MGGENQVIASAEAEMAVIGGALVAPVKFAEIAEIVSAGDFASELNRRIFGSMAAMDAAKQPIDVLTVAVWMEERGTLREGDWAYIASALRDTPSAANVLAYARVVRDRAMRRSLLRLGADLQSWAWRDDAETALAKVKAALDAVAEGAGPDSGLVTIKSLLTGVVEEIDKRFNGIAPLGTVTGLADFDKLLLGGLRDTDLIVVAGRPSMGKSTLGLQIGKSFADAGRTVAFFSAEMPSAQHVERLIASVGGIPLGAVREGKLEDEHWARLTSAVTQLSDAKIWFDETGSPRLSDILAKARRLKRQQGEIGLVIVDHAGLVVSDGETRQHSQAEVAMALKGLAKEMCCPVLALVQLNRWLEQRADRRPMMSDLRESGEWEQSADVIAMIYRDEIYSPDSPDKGCAELLVRKHRGGPIGVVPLAFRGEFSRFESLSGGLPSWRSPAAPSRSRGIEL